MAGDADVSPVHVLLAADDAATRGQCQGLLEEQPGTRVDAETDFRGAMASARQAPPDALVVGLGAQREPALQFIREFRALHADVPVVVVAARGSEGAVVAFLRSGATSYVPARWLRRDLVTTVRALVEARADLRRDPRVFGSLQEVRWNFRIGNDRSLVRPLVMYLQKQVARLDLCGRQELVRVGVALSEAMSNAIIHGNLEVSSDLIAEDTTAFERAIAERLQATPYRDRVIEVEAALTHQQAAFVVRDEGPGFDPARVPDPTEPENLRRAHGRGLLLIHTFMDEVMHNARGNEITLIKRRQPRLPSGGEDGDAGFQNRPAPAPPPGRA